VSASLLGRLVLAATVALWSALATAEGARPLELRGIMEKMGRQMQAITEAISHEDWTLVEKTAPLIAKHPQPPAEERARIIGFFGAEAAKFRGHDERSHDAAMKLSETARSGDGEAVIADFGRLQSACYGCHREYRKRLLDQFYGSR
jgi:cytochrome c556